MEKESVHGRLAVDFTRGSIPRELFSFALPLYLANLLQITYQMADMAIVGQMTGPVGLAAVSVGGDVANFLTALLDGIVLRLGLAVLFGLALGMGYMGFWLGDALSGFTPLFIGGALYLSGRWRRGAGGKQQAVRDE